MAASSFRLFSYKQTHDSGFAPNPFYGFCTLVTCKPGIRRTKRRGDWIAGFTSERVSRGRDAPGEARLIYLMLVGEILPLDVYFTDQRFSKKQASRPDDASAPCVASVGDNIYERRGDQWIQHPNRSHGPSHIKVDLSGNNALISSEFYYFGRDALVIPDDIRPRIPNSQSSYGWGTPDPVIAQAFLDFVRSRGAGIHGRPHSWKTGDDSWRAQ